MNNPKNIHPRANNRFNPPDTDRPATRAHDEAICSGLDEDERAQLRSLLMRMADRERLTPGVHPGFKRMGTKSREKGDDASEMKTKTKTAPSTKSKRRR